MIHPVPDDMGMKVRGPGGSIAGFLIVALILVDIDLDGIDAPPLIDLLRVSQQVFHRGVGFDVHHTLADGTASLTHSFFASLVGELDILLLHGAAGFFLHHGLDGIIVLPEADTLFAYMHERQIRDLVVILHEADAIGCQVGDFFRDEMENHDFDFLCPYCKKPIKVDMLNNVTREKTHNSK